MEEQWKSVGSQVYIGRVGGFDVRHCPEPGKLARRIVACVNACDGIPTEALECQTKAEFTAKLIAAHRAMVESLERLVYLTQPIIAPMAYQENPTPLTAGELAIFDALAALALANMVTK